MRNLKRALSLAMAAAMLIGMMVVGASAASFPDSDKIEHTDAVGTMVALGIIKGNEDGSFDPERVVTRAEMAKMICVALNGGKDPNLSGGGLFPDTKGNWAAGYIDFCANRGIVAGDNLGNFNPTKTVTGTEAAKMLLIALGYNAETEGFVNNANWDININVKASMVGLYDNVAINTAEGLSRDDAAQMIYDGIQAPMVKYEIVGIVGGNGLTQATELGKTILSDKFGMKDDIIVLTGVDKDSKGTYTLTGNKVDAVNGRFTKVEGDYSDLLGQEVKVLYKDTDDVYGVYATKNNTVVSSVQSAISNDGGKVKFGGKKYELQAATLIVDGEVQDAAATAAGLEDKDGFNLITLVDNDDDEKYEVAVVTTVTPAKVTYVSSSEIIAGGETYKYKDEEIADGLKKGDYVTVTYSVGKDKNVIEKVEALDGTVSGKKTGTPEQYQIDGTWYKNGSELSVDAGTDVTVYVVNGVIYFGEATSTTTLTDVVMLVKVADGIDTTVKFMYTDGTVVTGTVDTSKGAPAAPTSAGEGKLYTVKKATNGYRFEAVDGDIGDYNWVASDALTIADKKVGTKEISDTAAVLALSTEGNVARLYTGKQLKAMTFAASDSAAAGNVISTALGAFTSKVKGLERVSVVAVQIKGGIDNMPSGSVAGSNYALVVSDSYAVKDAITYDVWTGEEKLTVTDEDTDSVSEGDVILYDTIEGGTITGVAKKETADTLADGKLVNVSIRAIDGDNLYLNGDTSDDKFEITKDTVVMYYDSADMDGKPGGEIILADEIEDGIFVQNAKAITNGTDEILFLLVDVKNKLDDAATFAVTKPADASNVVFTLSGVNTDSEAAAGDVVTVKAAAAEGHHLVVADDAAVTAVDGVTFSSITVKDGVASFTFVMPAKAVTVAVTGITAEADTPAGD